MTATPASIDDLQVDDLQGKVTQRVVLESISWRTYQAMLADMGDHRSSRLTYDKGTLEIKMPSKLHEIINRLLELIITALIEELGLSIKGYGSTTLDREDLQKGVEPDSCFYIQNAERLQGLDPELPEDLPPDLAVEVDITISSTRRMGIYKQLGVPEIWRYTKQGITISRLENGEYLECQFSPTFPMISAKTLAEFLQQRQTTDDIGVIRFVRAWLRQWQKSEEVKNIDR
ncbi:MAG: Uma2 family endonuclease [Chroococcidiopsidaceae cyanobacterium CP_BM_RX_35]|nr:Uma2 family endonuclease [Chroococcidiopsidaceae cyanobacterium CP_BM_RX_35]